jgi:hypothetical protein
MAAFFTRVRLDGNPRQAGAQAAPPGISEDAKAGRPLRLPDSAKTVPAKFFLSDEPKVTRDEPVRPVLAAWLTAADNPYFARAMVNRTWTQYFGHGFVNPVDDIQPANPPSNPELFDELSHQFAAGGYDLKDLIRAICTSDTYQRTSKRPAGTADEDPRLFARMAIKPLSPEQLYDSLEQVLGKAQQADRPRPGQGQAPRLGPANPRAAFVAFFQTDESADPTEYQAGVPQALRLMNSAPMNSGGALLNQVMKSGDTPPQVVERLYLAALSRRPTSEESQKLTAYVARHDDARAAYGDILWALLNSSEFALNH